MLNKQTKTVHGQEVKKTQNPNQKQERWNRRCYWQGFGTKQRKLHKIHCGKFWIMQCRCVVAGNWNLVWKMGKKRNTIKYTETKTKTLKHANIKVKNSKQRTNAKTKPINPESLLLKSSQCWFFFFSQNLFTIWEKKRTICVRATLQKGPQFVARMYWFLS